jgi:hypothetical protein
MHSHEQSGVQESGIVCDSQTRSTKLEDVLVRKLHGFAIAGLSAAMLAGTAMAAAAARAHVINVPLADGSTVRVEYVGDVAPKVSVAPGAMADARVPWAMSAFPSFAGFEAMFAQMNRQMQQIQQMARQPGAAPGMNVAAYGAMPPGASSYSVSTVSNGACTRTTEVVSQGDGKPPKVTSNVSGNCAESGAAPAPAAPSGARVNRT